MRCQLASCAGRGLGPLALALLLLTAATVRAEADSPLPDNPLRRPAVAHVSDFEPAPVDSAAAIWDEPASDRQPMSTAQPVSTAQLIAAAQDLPPPAPPSIVPQRFGQPPPNKSLAGEPWYGGPPDDSAGGGVDRADHESWIQPWFSHTDPNDPYRHVGAGHPLVGTSWLNRPFYVGAFLGGLFADDLIADHVQTNNSFFIGARLGWDFDHYWGLEGRYAFSRPQISDATGDPLPDPAREYYVDVSLAYYPWGDSQWRPFFSAGLGLQTFRFHDDADERIGQSLLSTPIGVGLKFYHSPFHTLRLEAYDNIAWGDGPLDTMHNFTLAAGVEWRFGGRPTSYFPWHGSTAYW